MNTRKVSLINILHFFSIYMFTCFLFSLGAPPLPSFYCTGLLEIVFTKSDFLTNIHRIPTCIAILSSHTPSPLFLLHRAYE